MNCLQTCFALALSCSFSCAAYASVDPCIEAGLPNNNTRALTLNAQKASSHQVLKAVELMTAPDFQIQSTIRTSAVQHGKVVPNPDLLTIYFSFKGADPKVKDVTLSRLIKIPSANLDCTADIGL